MIIYPIRYLRDKLTQTPDSGAGSDTTAIALRAVVYFLCKNRGSLCKLRDELSQAERSARMSDPITYAEAIRLPYLQAVLKEAMRLHPSTGFPMGRVVPPGGVTLLGHRLPEGVGCAPMFDTFYRF